MKRYLIIFGLLGTLVAVADTEADAVMFRKKQESRPRRSFLEDVIPVKETVAPKPMEEPKPMETPKPAEASKPVVDEPQPATEEPKQTVEAPKPVAEPPKPIVEEPKPAAAEEPTPSIEAPKQIVEAPKQIVEAPKPPVEAPKQVAEAPKPDVTVEKKAADVKPAKKAKKEKKPVRDAIITADRTDYDRKEGVVLFDRNVYVDDEQYQMHADRLFLFLDGTNDLKRLVAIGHVAITNEDKRAYCARATFNKKLGRVVMYSSDEITAQLHEEGKKGSDVKGEKITFWLDSEQVEVENPVITMPGGFGGQESMKKLIGK